MRALISCVLLALLLVPSTHGAELTSRSSSTYDSSRPPYVSGQAIVHWDRLPSTDEQIWLRKSLGVTILRQISDIPVALLQLPEGMPVPEALAKLRQVPYIEHVEPNFTAHAALVPDDTYYEYQWNLGHESRTQVRGINIARSWELSTGKGVVIAVIDTGVAYEDYGVYAQAPDLAQTRFTDGYDFVNGDAHANDDQGHGTHVTGTLAQSTNNALGTAGIAFDATIMPIKALDDVGEGSHYAIASAIYFAARNGAHIINMSLGSPSDSRTLKQASKYASDRGLLLIAASGNEYRHGNPKNYPAAYDDYCIAVAATRYDDARAPYSNTGSHVDIAAPGGDLRVDQDRNGYGDGILQQTIGDSPTDFGYFFLEGTSMATPHVSAVAALLMATGVTDAAEVRDALLQTARDVGKTGHDSDTGWGVVDAWAALNYTPDQEQTPPPPVIEEPEPETPKHIAVAAIDMSTIRVAGGTEVRASVLVTDDSGDAVARVKVIGLWTGLLWQSTVGYTGTDGRAVFSSGTLRGYGSVAFRVRDLRKDGWVYDSSLNASMEGNITLVPAEVKPPARTGVGPSYPNPFNPDTWVPYQLAAAARVELVIYDTKGRVVHMLDLGLREAGEYHTPSRAIHWDGTNVNGEPVASGMYFYRFRAGDFVQMGRMMLRR